MMRLTSCLGLVTALLWILSNVSQAQRIQIKVNPSLRPATSSKKAISPPIGRNSSICYKDVGCYNSYPPFDNTGGVLPNPPEKIGTVFLLYTQSNKKVGQQMDYKDKGVSLKRTNFNPLYPTKFIIHGFTQDEREKWVHEMKDALLTTGPLNVVIVGWGLGAAAPDYPKAVANTRVVAKQVQMMIKLMTDQGMDLSRIHLIGHSLGAHVSGYAGADLNGQIGRISGMDPAGPFYEGSDETVRLNPSNAKFVDVIHSNAKPVTHFGAGILTASGHVDFYPNGGKSQPGCPEVLSSVFGKLFRLNIKGAGNIVTCSHSRSHYYFMESITQQGCTFLAHPCGSWEDYQSGKCDSCGEHGCSELGYHSVEYAGRGTYFLLTKGFKTAKAPKGEQFCGSAYDIHITAAAGSKNIKGNIDMSIKGTESSTGTWPFQGKYDSLVGDAKIVIVDYQALGDLTSVTLKYRKDPGWSFLAIGAGADEWNLDYVEVSKENKQYKFCFDKPLTVKTGSAVTVPLCRR